MSADGGSARLVVAVDFGTTFSGFAYARTSDPDRIFEVYEWPGSGKVNAKPYCKTLTSLFYAPPSGSSSDVVFDLVDWGWSALNSYTEAARAFANSDALSYGRLPGPPERDLPQYMTDLRLSAAQLLGSGSHPGVLVLPSGIDERLGFFANKFKLLLAPASNHNLSSVKLPGGLTAEKMVTDYLRCLTGFIMSELQTNYGKHISKQDVQWCLTVPAIWDERAKQSMKICAEKAGMVQGAFSPRSAEGSPFPIHIILEPEAASVYCQHKSKGLHLKKGDRMLVADVGGGTIDLVVHEKADADPESTRVHEVVSSYGDLGGGTFVDAAFFRYLCQKIGCFEEFCRSNKHIVLTIDRWWQGVKAGFDREGYSAELALPKKLREAWEKYEQSRQIFHENDDDYYDELRLDSSEIKSIFDTEVEKVIGLINKHLQGVRVLMVVGGFSASPYLRDRIRCAFKSKAEQIIMPENPGSAICHGAVQLHAKKDAIQSRIAKRTYGIACCRTVQDGDPFDLRYKNDDGQWRCRDCIDVFVRAGERVATGASVTRSYSPTVHGQTALGIDLVSSLSKFPKYLRDEGVSMEGKFTVAMSENMKLDKNRLVDATMVFGQSLIEVSAQRSNFGQAGKQKGLSVTFARE